MRLTVQYGIYRGHLRIADRTRGEPFVSVGVVGRVNLKQFASDTLSREVARGKLKRWVRL